MSKYRGDGSLVTGPPRELSADFPPKDFEPLGVLVVLKMVPVTESPGGIQLPDTVQELDAVGAGLEPRRGWVVSHGCQCRYVRRGDLVIVTGQLVHFRHKGQRLVLIQETNVVGIEQKAGGGLPEFQVTDWKDQVICRAGEDCDVRPGATVAEVMKRTEALRGEYKK